MIIVWILLWTLAFIIILKDYKTESTRWMSAIAFFTGLGAFSVVFEENIMKYFMDLNNLSGGTIRLLYYINALLSAVVHYLVPYCMLLYGMSYTNIVPKPFKKAIYFILFIPSILSFMLLPMKSNSLKTQVELLLYFKQLTVWTVPYMLAAICFLGYSYFKEKSYLIKKYKLLTLLIMGPCIAYVILFNIVLRAFGLENNWRYFAILVPLEFIGFLYFAYKYGIFGVKLKFERYKFAFDDFSEFVSDSFIALDESLNIIEVNEMFSKNFMAENLKHTKFQSMLESSKIFKYKDELISIIDSAKEKDIRIIEINLKVKGETRYFDVKASPILVNAQYFGTVLLFKDITLYKNNLELIKQNQIQLIEKERLLSLSQLIGGMAHNLKTPLMSSAGGIQIIKRDTGKLYEYIKNNCRETGDVTKLTDEINDWQQRIIGYLIYMSDVITTVKGQVAEYSDIPEDDFFVKEVIEKTTVLMAFELRKNKAVFSKEVSIDCDVKIKGDINSLVQVLNNLISNAIEASKEGGIIILGAFKEEAKVIFYVKNFGEKIPTEIQGKIFNKMVTTKGENGTGLGLYISKSIIKGRFNGEMYFNTSDKETTFFVKIPLLEEEI